MFRSARRRISHTYDASYLCKAISAEGKALQVGADWRGAALQRFTAATTTGNATPTERIRSPTFAGLCYAVDAIANVGDVQGAMAGEMLPRSERDALRKSIVPRSGWVCLAGLLRAACRIGEWPASDLRHLGIEQLYCTSDEFESFRADRRLYITCKRQFQ